MRLLKAECVKHGGSQKNIPDDHSSNTTRKVVS
jgi:hypothetical protein